MPSNIMLFLPAQHIGWLGTCKDSQDAALLPQGRLTQGSGQRGRGPEGLKKPAVKLGLDSEATRGLEAAKGQDGKEIQED